MKRFLELVIVGILFSTISSLGYSRSAPDDGKDRDLHRFRDNNLVATGILKCKSDSHKEQGVCDLQFVRLSDNQEFDVEPNSKLLQIHCNDHRDVKLKMRGTYTFRTIFGNDSITIESFENSTEIHIYLSVYHKIYIIILKKSTNSYVNIRRIFSYNFTSTKSEINLPKTKLFLSMILYNIIAFSIKNS